MYPALDLTDPQAWLEFAGRLHPLVVHFPIALLLVAFFLELIAGRARSPVQTRSVLVCLALGTLGAGAAVGSGWLLADQAGAMSPGRAADVDLHRWTGVVAAGLGAVALLVGLVCRNKEGGALVGGFRLLLAAAASVSAFAGHFGAALVWGEGYLLEPFREQATQASSESDPSDPVRSLGEAQVGPGGALLVADVNRVLSENCVECHGPLRRKGGLRLDRLEELFEGDPQDWLVQPGDPERSWLYHVVTVPPDDPDHMPEEGEPLDADELAILERWIAAGAPLVAGTDAEPATDADTLEGDTIDADAGEAAPSDDAESVRALPPSLEALLESQPVTELLERGAHLRPIAATDDGLEASFVSHQGPVGASALDALAPQVRWLDLSRARLAPGALSALASATRLERLRLDQTDVTTDELLALETPPDLRTVNLVGTAVDDRAVDWLAALPRLERVFLWGSRVTEQGAQRLRELRPDVHVDEGAAVALGEDP